ncbi:2-polyprenyl-6-methoxyphenol hydroxylase-like FAD-dependent oxidoreductase [Bradyrhizobium diazoefficiens]|uniref:FAD binding domain-containing protein n=1 Tax=Bradyrhizobium diazoefficiens TaxID=1355477 RepID=UPI00272B979D|nr:FAD-dependent monooxygenase [Bradyrhizobium diazoefficiens]WLA57570.1 FAD-dependent monooxygenase [Bradyrhizobium diazoefficiens]
MSTPRALVIGGSLSGLLTANLLRNIGWQVEIFERACGDLAGRGAGLGAQSDLFMVMRQIGIRIDRSMWTEVRSHVCVDRTGEPVCRVPVREVTTAWDRVYQSLRESFRTGQYHGGMTLLRCEQSERRVIALFENGTRIDGDLLIGADGIRSTVRRQYAPQVVPRYAGYVAWRGIVEESQIPPQWRATTLQDMVFCLPNGELAFSIPIADSDGAGHRRCMFVWFRPANFETTLRDWCTDATGVCHGDSIPPPLIRKEVVADLHLAARRLLAPQLAELVAGARQPILSAIFDLETTRMAFGRAALVGDAAFVARPHVGTSVTKAAQDAWALADELVKEGDVGAALALYERRRKPAGSELVARGRRLGEHLEPGGAGLRPPIDALLGEYGPGGIGEWPSTV